VLNFSAIVGSTSSTTGNYIKMPERSQMKNYERESCENISQTTPLAVTALEHVGFVMKDGRVYKREIGSSAGN
jgi:hypothetical protein